MSSEAELERLTAEIQRLRGHNRRYRELVQNIASRLAILGTRVSAASSGSPLLTAFENFGRLEDRRDVPQWDGPLPEMLSIPADTNDCVTPGQDLKPLVPNPGWRCLAVDRPQLRIGFTLFGMTDGEVEEAVALIEQRQVRSRDFVPVFVTEQLELAPFRSRGYVVEFVTTATDPRPRLEFLSAKWGLHKLVHLGQRKGMGKD